MAAVTVQTMWFRSSWNWFVGGVQEDLEVQTGKVLEWCQESLVSDFIRAQRTKMLTGMQTGEASLRGFQLATLAAGLQATCVILWQQVCPLLPMC